MMHRMIFGILLIVIGLAHTVFVQGQDLYTEEEAAHDSYQEALQAIEEAQRTGAKALDLNFLWPEPEEASPCDCVVSRIFLQILPPEISKLTHLEHLNLSETNLTSLPPEIGDLENLRSLSIGLSSLRTLPPEIGKLKKLELLNLHASAILSLPPEIGQLTNLKVLVLSNTSLESLPLELGSLTNLQQIDLYEETHQLTFPPPDIIRQGTPAILAYLRDYHAMQIRQTIATIAAGVGALAGVLLLFRWRQRRGLHEKKKRL